MECVCGTLCLCVCVYMCVVYVRDLALLHAENARAFHCEQFRVGGSGRPHVPHLLNVRLWKWTRVGRRNACVWDGVCACVFVYSVCVRVWVWVWVGV